MPDSIQDSLFGSPSAPSAWYTAHCDGGSRGNPGPAGFGAVIQDPSGQVVARLSEFIGRQTNNIAEYSGLLAVLDWALLNGVRRLRVLSDSELMVRQMEGRYKVASPTLRPLWEKARRRAAQLEQFQIRHTLREGNQEADRLANEAMDKSLEKSARQGPEKPAGQPASQAESSTLGKQTHMPLPGFIPGIVQDGVVRFLEDPLPEGTYVQVIPEPGKRN
ncbi:MAG TPA: ribonuclease HI family protein [Terracidiphilus sp.]|nr:ribonuclease HI family protein [Terracidiphilus sp.]